MGKKLNQEIMITRKILTWLLIATIVVLVVAIAAYFITGRHRRQILPLPSRVGGIGLEVEKRPGSASGTKMLPKAPGASLPESESSPKKRYKTSSAYLDVVASDVERLAKDLNVYVKGAGGFIVYSDIGTRYNPYKVHVLNFSARIPAIKLDDFMKFVKSHSDRVLRVQVYGRDITDEYENLSKKLELYKNTYARLEKLYNSAKDAKTLLEIQDRMVRVQQDIDRVTGRLNAMEQKTKYAYVSVTATSDKYAVAYMPKGAFDLKVTLRLAIRSLFITLAGIAKALIWIGVFSPLWVPVAYFVKKLVRG